MYIEVSVFANNANAAWVKDSNYFHIVLQEFDSFYIPDTKVSSDLLILSVAT
jgi:hypothetical protein